MITLLSQISEIINSTKESKKHEETTAETGTQPPLFLQQIDEGSPHGGNIGLSRNHQTVESHWSTNKEFKISRQVGKSDQREKLRFISLMHEIKTAKQAGYEESKISSVVLGSMSPSFTF